MKHNFLERFDRYIYWIWSGLWLVLFIQFSHSSTVTEAALMSLLYVATLFPFTTFLSKNLLEKAMRKRKLLPFILQLIFITLIATCLSICVFIVFNYLEKTGIFPRSPMLSGENSILHDFAGSFVSALLINFGFCGLRFFAENLKLQKVLIDSQLQILQEQINPHFMFNVLNHVNVLIRKEPDLASTVLVQYTNILRYQLYSGKKDFVSVGQEVGFLKDFIEVERIRWKNNLDVECSWSVEDDNAMLSPLLLITFVENAFKHVSRSKTEKGYVRIDLTQRDGELILFVENSKYADIPVVEKREASGIGLENIRKRLEILYPDRYHLQISETDTVYSVSLSITCIIHTVG
ncbi:sensor histidine kinase [Bacteroides sp. UBA939]|uniref:sensor histidine kinase n=1 Tax=Bacteroides sp. UBA939 TaxID=1946092 RepID=UPI0025B98B3D|nr:histidine kinase [Bacteroides sp. UBA939]